MNDDKGQDSNWDILGFLLLKYYNKLFFIFSWEIYE